MNHIFSWSRCLSRCSTLHNDLPFLLERKKIKKIEKLVTNLYDKSEYVIHIKNLKQALKHGLILKKVHRVIKFNQKDWLKPMEKMENVRKYSVIKLVTTKKKKGDYYASGPNYRIQNFLQKIYWQEKWKKCKF